VPRGRKENRLSVFFTTPLNWAGCVVDASSVFPNRTVTSRSP
jgi:hypothetical protein